MRRKDAGKATAEVASRPVSLCFNAAIIPVALLDHEDAQSTTFDQWGKAMRRVGCGILRAGKLDARMRHILKECKSRWQR